MTDVDNFLEHYGVKGMKWGKRKAKLTPRQQLDALDKMASKQNGHQVFAGASLRAYYAGKENKRATRKDANFDFKKLTQEQKDKFNARVNRRAYTDLALRGIGEAAAAAAIGKVGGKTLFGLDSERSTMSGAAFAGMVLTGRVTQMASISAANKSSRIHESRSEAYKQLDKKSKDAYVKLEKKRLNR